ncbi:hypothetical protein SLEP1_g25853 [Rubroshorea leprosula]|uniref:Uncharacterized protein n=1 Tax=Rubroshorea leprosula TaxID=152421 RepID=A0AAV5JQS2_9ROSI|nr:hypothetical protein SLEP1_g25853 [Rubroshorea leprosula]
MLGQFLRFNGKSKVSGFAFLFAPSFARIWMQFEIAFVNNLLYESRPPAELCSPPSKPGNKTSRGSALKVKA